MPGSDPAVEAARRTMEKQFGRVWANPSYHMTVRTDAAREALAPIRAELAEAIQVARSGTIGSPPHIDGVTKDEALDIMGASLIAVAPLIYSEEELDV